MSIVYVSCQYKQIKCFPNDCVFPPMPLEVPYKGMSRIILPAFSKHNGSNVTLSSFRRNRMAYNAMLSVVTAAKLPSYPHVSGAYCTHLFGMLSGHTANCSHRRKEAVYCLANLTLRTAVRERDNDSPTPGSLANNELSLVSRGIICLFCFYKKAHNM